MGARGVIVLVSALVVLGLALFMFDLPRPMNDDMAPSVRKGDLLFACRVCGAPKRGDVVLFTAPDGKGMIMRRVIGVPGDRVAVKNGTILVDDKPLPSEPAGTLELDGETFSVALETNGTHQYRVIRDGKVAPPPDRPAAELGDEYFLAADRRSGANDSRAYGPVPHGEVRSTVLRILRTGDGDATRPRRLP